MSASRLGAAVSFITHLGSGVAGQCYRNWVEKSNFLIFAYSLEIPIALGGPETPIPVTTFVRRRRIAPKTIRLRDKEHCKFVATQPCVVCGRTPSETHHIRFAQPRALNRKVSDEYAVPVCRLHHRDLHRYGDEASWCAGVNV
jgi:hypothetical protein